MSLYSKLCDMFMGPCIHNIPSYDLTIYLTFDDGPCLGCTDKVLDLLHEYEVKATFFVIVEKAEDNLDIISRMKKEGHAIGNHSLDHSYSNFFRAFSLNCVNSFIDTPVIYPQTG
jgi:hypothetical protein